MREGADELVLGPRESWNRRGEANDLIAISEEVHKRRTPGRIRFGPVSPSSNVRYLSTFHELC